MRHKVAGRQLNRTSQHRAAMRRNMAVSLIEHETISTTLPKAKELKPFVEKLITLAKKGNLAARRRAIALLGNRDLVDYEEGKPVKKGTIIGKLFSEIGPRYLERPGGYTRIIKLPLRRIADNGELVLLQLVGEESKAQQKREKAAEIPAEQQPETVAEAEPVEEQPESPKPEAAEQAEQQEGNDRQSPEEENTNEDDQGNKQQ